jgi:undecaprenyl-diphosphatase
MKVRLVLLAGVLALGAAVVAAATPPAEQPPATGPERVTTLQAAILGAIQGLTEYLPVSSTGHLILANYWMGLTRSVDEAHKLTSGIVESESVNAFDVVLHAGTFLAVLGLYRKRVGQMAKGLVGRDPRGFWLLVVLVVAAMPALGSGYVFKKLEVEKILYNPVAVAAALAVGGVLMIVIEHYFWRRKRGRERTSDVCGVRLWQALVIGFVQCVALWPGTSRSMITILAALVIGLDMLAAAEFSFLLALPTLGAATAFTLYKEWQQLVEHVGPPAMVVGLVVTFIVAVLAMKGLIKWLTSHGLAPFGIYRIALAAAVLAYFAM